jgi:hypothetical protein
MFFGALLLLVLLAGLHMPTPQALGACASPTVSCVERAATPIHPANGALPLGGAGERATAARSPVRPMPRTRSVAERGLPCPRAPTA